MVELKKRNNGKIKKLKARGYTGELKYTQTISL